MKLNYKKLEKATPKILKECAGILIKIVQKNIKGNLFKRKPWGSPLADETIKRRVKKRNAGTSIPQLHTPLYETGKLMKGLISQVVKWNKIKIFSTGKSKKIQKAISHFWSQDGEGRNIWRKDQPSGEGKDLEAKLFDVANARYAKIMRVEAGKFAKYLQRKVNKRR